MSEISSQSGRQFDPDIVAAFLRVLPVPAVAPSVLIATRAGAAA